VKAQAQNATTEQPATTAGSDEVRLSGGNLTPVVRVGDTVRRGAGPWTPLVHDLLRHLRARGWRFGPEPLGLDDQGREVLSFVPGETMVSHPWPRWVWSDEILMEAAATLASYHRAVADFRPAVVHSRLGSASLAAGQIVCHNDFAPYNAVFRGSRLVGVIDWDVVCPAPPDWDLAFAAWHWVPLHAPSPELAWRTVDDCTRRLRLLVDRYGSEPRRPLSQLIMARIESSRSGIIERARSGDDVFARLERDGHPEEMARAIDFVDRITTELDNALT
jgi:thiamine kinase-like enzyme